MSSPTFVRSRPDGEGTEMVLLARRYQVPGWLERGLQALVQCEEFFDADEKQLGRRTVFRLCRLREICYWNAYLGWNMIDMEIRLSPIRSLEMVGIADLKMAPSSYCWEGEPEPTRRVLF